MESPGRAVNNEFDIILLLIVGSVLLLIAFKAQTNFLRISSKEDNFQMLELNILNFYGSQMHPIFSKHIL